MPLLMWLTSVKENDLIQCLWWAKVYCAMLYASLALAVFTCSVLSLTVLLDSIRCTGARCHEGASWALELHVRCKGTSFQVKSIVPLHNVSVSQGAINCERSLIPVLSKDFMKQHRGWVCLGVLRQQCSCCTY